MIGAIGGRLRRLGLPERLLAVLLLVVVFDFAANSLVFQRINRFALQQDDAERIAENLVLSKRAMERADRSDRAELARFLSTNKFWLEWRQRRIPRAGSLNLNTLRAQIVENEPELASGDLELHLEEIRGRGDIGGSLLLSDRSSLHFHTHAEGAWSLTAGRIASLVLPTLLLIALAWVLLRAMLKPLQDLIGATRELGTGLPEPVPEKGPDELRSLIRALNDMQERIHQSLLDRTQTMVAIGHDLKTPLSRLNLRLEDETLEPELREGIRHDIDEMKLLLESVQAYVDSDGRNIPVERIDISAMAETLVDSAADRGADASFSGVYGLEVMARPVAIRRALSNLIENAIHYGGNVRVYTRRDGGAAEIVVEDDGPGIPEDRITDALQPFVRLDTARTRDTAGMGLGLAIVRKSVRMDGGSFDVRNRPEGGLRATVRLPLSKT
jgi:signal transduction histidine kinase